MTGRGRPRVESENARVSTTFILPKAKSEKIRRLCEMHRDNSNRLLERDIDRHIAVLEGLEASRVLLAQMELDEKIKHDETEAFRAVVRQMEADEVRARSRLSNEKYVDAVSVMVGDNQKLKSGARYLPEKINRISKDFGIPKKYVQADVELLMSGGSL